MIQSLKRKFDLTCPELFFPLIILIIGVFLILITPMGANNDEETYIARIFEMSLGHIMPNSFLGEGRNYPAVLISDSYRQDVNLWPVDGPTWMEQAKARINWNNRDFDSLLNYKTRAVYFPTLFIIQAPIMRIMGPRLDIPVVFIYYALRFSYLLIYLLLVYFALRIIPFGKWPLGVIAVAPMSLITAASISPDPIIFGVCFVFIAWILFLITQSYAFISKKHLIITCAIILAIGALKPNYIFLVFLLFALPHKGFLKRRDIIVLSIVSLLGVGISLGWTYLASQVIVNQLNSVTDTLPRLLSLFQEPQIFITLMAKTIAGNFITYLMQAIGASGYSYWSLPKIIYFLYPLAVILSFFIEKDKNTLSLRQKVIILLTGILNFIVIFLLFFVTITPLGSSTIIGLAGRYFVPFIPLFLLPFVFQKPLNGFRYCFMGLIGFISLLTSVSLFLAYHVICGGFWFSGQICKLPYYKNWGPETFIPVPLSKGSAIDQNFIVDCQTISHIELWPLQNDETPAGQVILNLRSGAGELLSASSFATDGIPANAWYSVDIPDVVGMKGSALTIEILPAEDQNLSQFALGVFPTDEYTKGELFIKDGATGKSTTSGNDLIFKYQCEKP